MIHGSATGFVEGGLCAGPGLAGFFVYHKRDSSISSGAALIRQVVGDLSWEVHPSERPTRKWMCMLNGYTKKK